MLRGFSRGAPMMSAANQMRAARPLLHLMGTRGFAMSSEKMRNIGISAHIDSGKTTLTERILFYCGKTHAIHDVKGKDGVGAKMDHMELEREKGITITSAATYTTWDDHPINIIDTPGHVDFTIEVERALRVLDGAILVLCGVAGVQSQSLTVDRQMRRYNVPRVAFINKLDRTGADPWRVIDGVRKMLRQNAAAVQIPMGLEFNHTGVVDLLNMQTIMCTGPNGETIVYGECPAELKDEAEEKRGVLIEALSEVDDDIAEKYLEGEDISADELQAAIRRTTILRTFMPVFMGSAFKNKGVQPMLDGVAKYLPSPSEVENIALQIKENNAPLILDSDNKKPFVGLAFKLEESKFGQLTYIRVYQGSLKKGDVIWDTSQGKKIKVPRVVKMHAADMEDVTEVGSGEIAAMFGVDCASGTTFCKPGLNLSMISMHVPKPVISLAIAPKKKESGVGNFGKALARFQKEDPTFSIQFDAESQETIMSGMGELHLQIYAERLFREYGVETIVGAPQVNYRETITQKAEFEFIHKKQTGGSGQYAKIVGYIEPVDPEEEEAVGVNGETGPERNEFVNGLSGNNVPPEFVPAIMKGFQEACAQGACVGAPLQGVKFVVTDGQSHAVDSSELAFRVCSANGVRAGMKQAMSQVLEPIMNVEVEVPGEFQGNVVGGLNKRKAMIEAVDSKDESYTMIKATCALKDMFGYSTDLRGGTEGKGEFSMEYKEHSPVNGGEQLELMKQYQLDLKAKQKDD